MSIDAVLGPEPQLRASKPPRSKGASRYPGRGDALGLAAILVAYAIFCTYAVRMGMPVSHVLRATAAVAVFQLAPGVLIWRTLRPRQGWLLEDLSCGFACGFGLSVPVQALGGLADSRLLSLAVPSMVSGLLLSIPGTRTRIRTARWKPVSSWLGLVIALSSVGAVPGLVKYMQQNPVSWGEGFRAPQVDQYFQLSLVQELLHRGPVGWPLVAGEDLSYHWFAHAWMAHVSAGSGVPPDEILLRYAPTLSPFLIVVGVAALGLRAAGRPLLAAAAVVLTMFGGTGSLWGAIGISAPLNPESPTLALSVPPLLALSAVLAMRWRGQQVRWPYAVIVGLAVIASGTKGSATPLVIAGTGLTAAAMLLWDRPRAAVVLRDLVALVVALWLTIRFVFHGSANSLLLDPTSALDFSWPARITGSMGTLVLALGAATMLFGGLSRASLGFAALARDDDLGGRRDPVLWLLLGASIAGACAPLLFVQPGASQFYFRISAIPFAALASAMALRSVQGSPGARSVVVAALAVLGGLAAWWFPMRVVSADRYAVTDTVKVLAVGVFILAATAGAAAILSGIRSFPMVVAGAVLTTGMIGVVEAGKQPLPQPQSHPGPKASGSIGADQVAAAQFIRDRSAIDDLVMTNRHCIATPERKTCDSRYFMVGAQSGRQMLLEGWGYSPTIASRHPVGRESITAPFWDEKLLQLNDGFYTSPTDDSARNLWERGVRWVYVDTLFPHGQTLAPYATLRLDNGQAQVWQLAAPR